MRLGWRLFCGWNVGSRMEIQGLVFYIPVIVSAEDAGEGGGGVPKGIP